MNGSGRAGNGRGNNRKRSFGSRSANDSSRHNESSQKGGCVPQTGSKERHGRAVHSNNAKENTRGEKLSFYERPKWSPPKLNTDPLPVPLCSCCGKPIRDVSSAMTDKDSGTPVHFDCAAARITESETLEKGDSVVYIGGGRFGIVTFGDSGREPLRQNNNTGGSSFEAERPQIIERFSSSGRYDFKIKKIIEWESKDTRAPWRSEISDHYSIT